MALADVYNKVVDAAKIAIKNEHLDDWCYNVFQSAEYDVYYEKLNGNMGPYTYSVIITRVYSKKIPQNIYFIILTVPDDLSSSLMQANLELININKNGYRDIKLKKII